MMDICLAQQLDHAIDQVIAPRSLSDVCQALTSKGLLVKEADASGKHPRLVGSNPFSLQPRLFCLTSPIDSHRFSGRVAEMNHVPRIRPEYHEVAPWSKQLFSCAGEAMP